MSKKKVQVAVIDATTGTVLGADNLFYVEAPEKALDKASNSDSAAFTLAMSKGYQLSQELMSALLKGDPEGIIDALGWESDVDNEGQIIAYTGECRKMGKK